MRRELRRYLTELGLSLLRIGAVVSGIIGIRYRSYQGGNGADGPHIELR